MDSLELRAFVEVGDRLRSPKRLTDPNGFLVALEEFPVTLASDSLEALVNLWNGGMAKTTYRLDPNVSSHKVEQNWPHRLMGSW